MNNNLKKPLLLWSLALLVLGAGVALAQQVNVNVKSDLTNAIQNIKKVYFAPGGVKNADPSKNILVDLSGVVRIHGKVVIEHRENENGLGVSATDSSIIQGKNNHLSWSNSLILGGTENWVSLWVEKGIIVGWNNNFLEDWTQSGIILGGEINKIKNWSNAVIAGGLRNEIEGNTSVILGGGFVGIKGDNSVAGGSHITGATDSSKKDSVFLWSDSLEHAIKNLSPVKDKTFLIRSANGVGIGTNDPQVKGIDVAGVVQISDQNVACEPATDGAIKYQGAGKGCFCACNGHSRGAMSQSKNCIRDCKN